MRVRLGCLSLLFFILLAIALPFFFLEILRSALIKLHLSP